MTGAQGQLEDIKEFCSVWMSAYSHHVYTLKFLLVALHAFPEVIMPGIMNFNGDLELSNATVSGDVFAHCTNMPTSDSNSFSPILIHKVLKSPFLALL